jgi:hypothetical protein
MLFALELESLNVRAGGIGKWGGVMKAKKTPPSAAKRTR